MKNCQQTLTKAILMRFFFSSKVSVRTLDSITAATTVAAAFDIEV